MILYSNSGTRTKFVFSATRPRVESGQQSERALMQILMLLASLLLVQTTERSEAGTVSGQVRSVDGSPAINVRVAAMAIDETGGVNPISVTFASLGQTDSEGRYRLEQIPPGRYFITGGFLDSPSYFPGVRTPAEARSINVSSGATTAEIDFTLARSGGVRVRGRLKNIPIAAPPGLIRVTLNRPGRQIFSQPICDVGADPDGTFECLRVRPGSYSLSISASPTLLLTVEVAEVDVDDVEVAVGPTVFGRVTVEDGTPVPIQTTQAAGSPALPTMVRLQATRVNTSGWSGSAIPRQDGLFALSFPLPGDYDIIPALLPLGYYVKSFSDGTADILRSPMATGAESNSTELQMVLTTTPPAGTPPGVKVSGRVTGLQNISSDAPVMVSIQSLGATGKPMRAAEVAAKGDGTFEITGVPPGRYSLRAIDLPAQPLSVNILRSDVAGLEVAVRNPGVTGGIPGRP